MSNRSDLELIGAELLQQVRTELFLSMRFLGPAMGELTHKMDLSTQLVATDAEFIRYNPVGLIQMYKQHPYVLARTYLHLLLHCIFRHMLTADTYPDEELWNLSADIAVEHVIDGMDNPVVNRTSSDFREEWYARLEHDVKVLTAERLYRYFSEDPPAYELLVKLMREFEADDHVFWRMLEKRKKKDDESRQQEEEKLETLKKNWEKTAKRVRAELDAGGSAHAKGTGTLDQMIRFDTAKRTDFRALLRQFAVNREECKVDPDSFDYAFYYYGMELYGNMPLIEENEFVESRKIAELVIALDTSASLRVEDVRTFLSQTADLLESEESFFEKVEIHIVTCDAEIKEDVVLTKASQIRDYARGFHISGGGGTDYRPVFKHVEELKKSGYLRNLKGLLYFTDGFGRYPKKRPDYTTAFVFQQDGVNDETDVPAWALKLYMKGNA